MQIKLGKLPILVTVTIAIAKFIPQIVSRLVEKYSKKGDLVLDPFVGSGTTLLEAKVMGRNSLGLDINPVATLISQAKITPIKPSELIKNFLLIQIS